MWTRQMLTDTDSCSAHVLAGWTLASKA